VETLRYIPGFIVLGWVFWKIFMSFLEAAEEDAERRRNMVRCGCCGQLTERWHFCDEED
jgi:hypothetical protein